MLCGQATLPLLERHLEEPGSDLNHLRVVTKDSDTGKGSQRNGDGQQLCPETGLFQTRNKPSPDNLIAPGAMREDNRTTGNTQPGISGGQTASIRKDKLPISSRRHKVGW